MRPIDLPCAVDNARRPKQPAALFKKGSERKRRRHARAKYEQIGRVTVAKARRNPARKIVLGNVGDENDEHPQPPEHVQPGIAQFSLLRDRRLFRCALHSFYGVHTRAIKAAAQWFNRNRAKAAREGVNN